MEFEHEHENEYDTESSDEHNEEEEEDEYEYIPNAKDITFTSKETFYYKMIDKYFKTSDPALTHKMIDIIEGNDIISLRLLDWFVTRYSNKHKVIYDIGLDEKFNVHISYKAQLRSYKKRYFDPFRRRKKFYYNYKRNDKMEKIVTTIGQMNFFRWAFVNEIVQYVEQNYDTITKAMIYSNKFDKKRKRVRGAKNANTDKQQVEIISNKPDRIEIKKNGINIKAKKNVTNDQVKIILSFD